MKITTFVSAVTAAGLAVSLAACAPSSENKSASSDGKTKVTIGIVDVNEQQQVLKDLAAKNGIDIEYKTFSDYNQPNPALVQKQTDLNWFQHIAFLADFNLNSGSDLVAIAPTEIVPLSLYSKKHKSVDELKSGGTIAIANDTINQARGLNLLKAQGLVELKSNTIAPSALDVDTAKSKVKVVTVDPTQTVVQLDSLDGAIVNNTFLQRADLDPNKALAKDNPQDPSAIPYVNAFVSRPEDKDNATYKKIGELYHSKEVQDAVTKQSKGTSVEAKTSPEEMAKILKQYENSLKAAKKK